LKGIKKWAHEINAKKAKLPSKIDTDNLIIRKNYEFLLKNIQTDASKSSMLVAEIQNQLSNQFGAISVDLVGLERALIGARYCLSLAEGYSDYVSKYKEKKIATFLLDPTMCYPVLPIGKMAHVWEDSFYDWSQKGKGFENPQVRSDSVIVPALPGRRLKSFGCRGIYVPYSFAIATLVDLKEMKFEVSPLKSTDGGEISSSDVDIRVVAPWYYPFGGKPRLMNELLLHDPKFVVPDKKTTSNIFKDAKYGSDAKSIMPLDLPKGTSRQFYLTVKVPKNAKAGLYSGTIKIKTSDGIVINWPLQLEVLPYDLDPTPNAYAAYYRSYLVSPERKKAIGNHSWFKTEDQMNKELVNMAEHGLNVYNHYNSASSFDLEELGKYLTMAKNAGLTRDPWIWIGPPVPYRTTEQLPTREAVFEEIDDKVGRLVKFCKERGFPRPALYGYDEIGGEKLVGEKRPATGFRVSDYNRVSFGIRDDHVLVAIGIGSLVAKTDGRA